MKKFWLISGVVIHLLALLNLSFMFVYGIVFGVISGIDPEYYGSPVPYAVGLAISLWLMLLLYIFVWRKK